MHLVLGIQKQYQRERSNKGNTIFVFDDIRSKDELTDLILEPPAETAEFYKRGKKQEPLDQVIDVPYFADSKHVGLIQLADLFAFLICLYAELEEGVKKEKFEGESARLTGWLADMRPFLLKDAARWPATAKDPCTRFFRAAAPPSLLRIAA